MKLTRETWNLQVCCFKTKIELLSLFLNVEWCISKNATNWCGEFQNQLVIIFFVHWNIIYYLYNLELPINYIPMFFSTSWFGLCRSLEMPWELCWRFQMVPVSLSTHKYQTLRCMYRVRLITECLCLTLTSCTRSIQMLEVI